MRTAVAITVLLLLSGVAYGDNVKFPVKVESGTPEPLRPMSEATCTTEAGSTFKVAPKSVILLPQSWDVLDYEVHRLQEAETRLTAENESFRRANIQGAQPSWASIVILAVAVAAGAGVGYWASR